MLSHLLVQVNRCQKITHLQDAGFTMMWLLWGTHRLWTVDSYYFPPGIPSLTCPPTGHPASSTVRNMFSRTPKLSHVSHLLLHFYPMVCFTPLSPGTCTLSEKHCQVFPLFCPSSIPVFSGLQWTCQRFCTHKFYNH